MTASVYSLPLNNGDFTKTTLPIGWLLSILLAVQTVNLSSKLPTKIHPASGKVIFRHQYVMQKNSSCIKTEKSYLYKVLHFNRQNEMLINSPNNWATAYGSY